ncbi:hypothetical protein BP5796_10512 [Coleophoma crateriformis]|uniref:YTH domain-containing protein n=1 Tax=Coleophoma crateriformis TaxID=565419 RepID=A0A3D8QQT5_9HELO|nr:hypothetical protein BP5796_10512 [Coleophoma crateriformis]
MAYIIIQYCALLPTVHETFMGDANPAVQPDGEYTNSQEPFRNSTTGPTGLFYDHNDPASSHYVGQTPQYQGKPPPDSFAMNSLGAMLPDTPHQNYGASPNHRFQAGPTAPGMLFQRPNMPQYAGQSGMNQQGNVPYNIQFQGQYQTVYSPQQYPSSFTQHPLAMHGSNPGGQLYPAHFFVGQQQPPQSASPFFSQPTQYGHNPVYSGNHSGVHYGVRASYNSTAPNGQRSNEYLGSTTDVTVQGRPTSIGSSAGQSSVVRGPPRKPRQSGHAIWIGNLPPQTELMNLVYHVCKESVGLESLFLISKSNCAFANYKDEAACAAAQSKIHDSKFQTVRLVSRLRRSSIPAVAGVTVPTGPAALSPPQEKSTGTYSSDKENTDQANSEAHEETSEESSSLSKDKFFIVKSLTMEDLELSVRNGQWATQSHNEEALNKAYETADNVYLVFSANKSGEYFGYARMSSPINNDPAAAIEFAPKAQAVEDPELPKAIPTTATGFAPKGRIIDDSARGTIFWEAERDEPEEAEDDDDVRSSKSEQQDGETIAKAWGKPFKVEWVSTVRLPFYRTRGLRNPWNSNREVKIARDGTELETGVGRRLLALFHRLPSPPAPGFPLMQAMPQAMGPMVAITGYPPVRPYQ